MPKLHLTARSIARLAAPTNSGKQIVYFDDELKGFAVQCSGTTNSKLFIVQRDVAGKSRRVTVGACNELTLDAARTAAADILHQMRQGQDPKKKVVVPTLQSTLDAYLAARSGLASGSVRMYRTIERTLEPWLARELHTITPEMVEARHRELAGVNARYKGEANANFAMKTLGILYGFAEERHAGLPPNPVKRLKRQWYKEPRRTRMVRTEELPTFYEAVLALENHIIRDYILLILFTGLRRLEAASLRWSDVDFVEGVIRLPASRTKARRALDLPMSDYVRDLLVARRSLGNAGFVFPGRRHNQHLTGSIETAWAQLAATTGIKVSAHDLRRTFASVAGETEISPYALKATLNHATGTDVTAGYVFLSPTALRQAVQKVADRMKGLCGIVPVKDVTRLRRGF